MNRMSEKPPVRRIKVTAPEYLTLFFEVGGVKPLNEEQEKAFWEIRRNCINNKYLDGEDLFWTNLGEIAFEGMGDLTRRLNQKLENRMSEEQQQRAFTCLCGQLEDWLNGEFNAED